MREVCAHQYRTNPLGSADAILVGSPRKPRQEMPDIDNSSLTLESRKVLGRVAEFATLDAHPVE